MDELTIALNELMRKRTVDNAAEVLQAVRRIVYAGYDEEWYKSPLRIDDFQITVQGVRLVVSDAQLRIVYYFSEPFAQVIDFQPSRVA